MSTDRTKETVHVVTSVQRRRYYSPEQKQRMVDEAEEPGAPSTFPSLDFSRSLRQSSPRSRRRSVGSRAYSKAMEKELAAEGLQVRRWLSKTRMGEESKCRLRHVLRVDPAVGKVSKR